MAKSQKKGGAHRTITLSGSDGKSISLPEKEAINFARHTLYTVGDGEALFYVRQMEKFSPARNGELCLLQSEIWNHRGDFQKALNFVRNSLAKKKTAEGFHQLAKVWLNLGKNAESIDAIKKAIQLSGKDAELYTTAAKIFKESGDIKRAALLLEKAIGLKPEQLGAYAEKVLLPGATLSHSELQQCRNMLDNPSIQAFAACKLHFTLARHYEVCDEIDEQVRHLQAGNQIKHGMLGKHSRVPDYVDASAIGDVFTREAISAAQLDACNENLIFIVGFPRSGSTLVEQILSAHTSVSSAGETLAIANSLIETTSGDYPRCFSSVTRQSLLELRSRIIDKLALFNHSSFLTEKSLDNIFYIGLIKILFPQAKIVHNYKHPVECCFGCYRQLFEGGAWGYIYDLNSLAEGYKNYYSMMQYWESVFPGEILHFRYEDLVDDQRAATERLLNYCGLEWDERSLDFTNNTNNVSTASSAQVRQPLHAGSIGRWKRYKQHLQPLLELEELPEWPIHEFTQASGLTK